MLNPYASNRSIPSSCAQAQDPTETEIQKIIIGGHRRNLWFLFFFFFFFAALCLREKIDYDYDYEHEHEDVAENPVVSGLLNKTKIGANRRNLRMISSSSRLCVFVRKSIRLCA